MLLADSAQAIQGKLYILGGGWSQTGPLPVPSAVAIKIEVPWNDANRNYKFKLFLVDEDNKSVKDPSGKPIEITGGFEAGRPAGIKAGTPLDVPLAINFGPIPLTAGKRFFWKLSIDGKSEPDWNVGFNVRPDKEGEKPAIS